jgi:hypothetical protein
VTQEKVCRFFTKDRNFMVQDRVNEHLLSVAILPEVHRGLVMNLKNEKTPHPPPLLPVSLLPDVPAAKGSATSLTSDCLYQFAALIAGAFLLATML